MHIIFYFNNWYMRRPCDVNKALNDLKSEADGVKGFWTAAPLDWGFAVGDKVPIPTPSHGWTELIAENPAPTSPDLTTKA